MSDLARIRLARQGLASPSRFDWMDDAACRGVDTEAFFPPERIGKGGGRRHDERPALALCRACPVRQACLDAALDEEKSGTCDTHGIRGGLTADERRQIIRRRTGYKPEQVP